MSSPLAEIRARASAVGEHCQQHLWPRIEELDSKFKIDTSALKSAVFKFGPVLLIGIVLMKMAASQKHASTFQYVIWSIGLIAAGVSGVVLLNEFSKIARIASARTAAMHKLAGEIKHDLARFLDPGFSLEPTCTFPEQLFKGCELFPPSYDSASASNRFFGKLGKTKFSAMDIATYEKITRKDSNGRKRVTYVPIYKGILFQADFNKNFKGKTTVRTDSIEKSMGGFARTAQRFQSVFSSSQLIELENPTFEAAFKVHSTDANEARYILTPVFMERILEIKQKRGVDIQLAFQNSSVIIAMPNRPDSLPTFFDLRNLSTSADAHVRQLIDTLELIEDLDLNNHISKAS